jgi:hypothetical protein
LGVCRPHARCSPVLSFHAVGHAPLACWHAFSITIHPRSN